MRTSWLGLGLAVLFACGDASDVPGGGGQPDPIGDRLAQKLAGLAQVSRSTQELSYKVRQPAGAVTSLEVNVDNCTAISGRLEQLCNDLGNATGSYCYGHATFFWAHDVPRCSGRLEFPPVDYMADELPTTYTFDLTGTPRVGGGDGCGDGEIDTGETCDDGNHDLWDGCDSNCQMEEFTGCETVIENEFAVANVAWIDRAEWASPRSHLMVHQHAGALRPMDRALCGEAKVTAQTVCSRLQQDMPFVGWCDPRVEFLDSTASCAVRLTVGFQALDPAHGVFTTSLQGILSFTIR